MCVLNFNVQPFNGHISAMVRALFNINNHCRTVFFHSDEKVIDLRGQHCPVNPLKVHLIVQISLRNTHEIISSGKVIYESFTIEYWNLQNTIL